jgi:hypothetical protein
MSITKQTFKTWQSFILLAGLALLLALTIPTATADGHQAHVTVYHNINGTAAGAVLLGDSQALGKEATVDVYVNDDLFLNDFQFGDMAGPVPLGPGTYNIKIEVDGTGIFIIDQDVTLSAGDNAEVYAKLGKNGTPRLQIKLK